jgi:hypothetical protein
VRLVPFDWWTLDSKLSAAELLARLEALVEPEQLLRLGAGGPTRPFQGEVSPQRFSFSRILRSRNAFLPQLVGQVVPTPTGSRLEVLLRPRLVTLGFLSSSFMFLGMVGLGVLRVRGLADPGAFGPLLLFALGYTVTVTAFSSEAKRARALLEPVLK